jgi:hypothetical protein
VAAPVAFDEEGLYAATPACATLVGRVLTGLDWRARSATASVTGANIGTISV